jgi:hypothetical protein
MATDGDEFTTAAHRFLRHVERILIRCRGDRIVAL